MITIEVPSKSNPTGPMHKVHFDDLLTSASCDCIAWQKRVSAQELIAADDPEPCSHMIRAAEIIASNPELATPKPMTLVSFRDTGKKRRTK